MMAYSDFKSLESARTSLGLSVQDQADLFSQVSPVAPSSLLRQTLQENLPLATAISTEKARSELLIAPILLEVRRSHYPVGFFSGVEFAVDASIGLTGVCDFLLTMSSEQSLITAPVLTLVEAKNENIKGGLGQCAAQMRAAWLYNAAQGTPQPTIYGVVTTGTNWKFLQLVDTHLQIDLHEYYILQIEIILGILAAPLAYGQVVAV
jgi:hypothetical protein